MTAFGLPNESNTGYLVPPLWLDSMYRSILGLGPETRSPEQIAIDRAKFKAESIAIAAKIKAEHAAALEASSLEVRPFLEMHGPMFSNDDDRWPTCNGCDMQGYEAEPPGFPCRTYELATGASQDDE